MKKSFVFGMLILLAFTLTFSACSSDDESINNNDNSAEIQAIQNTAESGTWRITYFFDTDTDETSNFSGYQFLFNPDGTITAGNDVATVSGTWSVRDDSNSSSSSSGDDIDFNIFFSSPPNFAELSDDWDIMSTSSTKIELMDVSGGNGGTDLLTFEKL